MTPPFETGVLCRADDRALDLVPHFDLGVITRAEAVAVSLQIRERGMKVHCLMSEPAV
jgi:hypothetical protein